MLARIWDPSEATSIWSEIVKQRSEKILQDLEDGCLVNLSDASAARNPISRQQLAEWDASARAWLHAADRVKAHEQKQLMLILDNVQQRVNSIHGTFNSVIKAWQDSLTIFEALLDGVSQKANDGEILLALCAWHLYPDLMVVEPRPQAVKQRDKLLLSCGILTIGLHRAGQEYTGLCWSLPLAQLRHYGAAVTRERTINSTQRLTLEEFSQVFLGGFLRGWGDTGTETTFMVKWRLHVRDVLSHLAQREPVALSYTSNQREMDSWPKSLFDPDNKGSWLHVLFDASEKYVKAVDNGDNAPKQLLRLGRQYSRKFLGKPVQGPYFGLSENGNCISCAKSEDDKVQMLRDVAINLPGSPNQMFIRVRSHHHKSGLPQAENIYEYATAKPIERPSSKRQNDGTHQPNLVHRRWIRRCITSYGHTKDTRYYRKLIKTFPELASSTTPKQGSTSEAITPEKDHQNPDNVLSRCHAFMERDDPIPHFLPAPFPDLEERVRRYSMQGEEVLSCEECGLEDFQAEKMGVFWPEYTNSKQTDNPWYCLIYGDDSAALFADCDAGGIRLAAQDSSLQHFQNFFRSSLLDPNALSETLYKIFASADANRPYWRSLKAISSAASLYTNFRIATIDIRVLEHQFDSFPWMRDNVRRPMKSMSADRKFTRVRNIRSPPPNTNPFEVLASCPLDIAGAFSCICFFESGRFQVEPSNIKRVMALCSNDLIWVASYMLNDPSSNNLDKATIKAIPGNIGRPGIAFMIPPLEPMIRPKSIQDFRNVIHRPFEGQLLNSFRTTSLHLSFTTAKSPLQVDFSGMQDDELYVLETLLSVHDGGDWIADLDVWKSLTQNEPVVFKGCEHKEQSQHASIPEASCIDNWAELLDPPESPLGVVRASGDWQARLATFTVATALGNHVVMLPTTICRDCFGKRDWLKYGTKIIIIA